MNTASARGAGGATDLRTEARLCWALFVAALLYSAIRIFGMAVNFDVAAYLLEARAVAEGRDLYTSFREFNLPSNIWLPMLSLRLSRTLPLLIADIHLTLLVCLLAFACGLTGHIVRTVHRDGAFGLIAPAYFALVFVGLPGLDFGQREPLFAALAAPLLATIWARLNGVGPSPAIGVVVALLAAFGASQKPHFMAALAAVGLIEWALVRRIGKIAPETWGTAILLALYVGWILIRYPTYFGEVLPDVLVTYGSMGKSLAYVTRRLVSLQASGFVGASLLLLALIWMRSREHGMTLHRRLVVAWLAVLATATAVVVIQRQGLPYHRFVLESVATVSVGILACRLLDLSHHAVASRARSSVRGLVPILMPLLVLAVAAIPRASPPVMPPTRAEAIADPMTAMMRASPGAVVLALQTGTPPVSPLHAYADIRWRAGFTTLFEMRPIILRRDQGAASQSARDQALLREESALRSSALEAVREKPDLVFVDASLPLRWFEDYPRAVRILDFLREDPAFAAAWAEYELVSTFTTILDLRVEAYRPRSRRTGIEPSRS